MDHRNLDFYEKKHLNKCKFVPKNMERIYKNMQFEQNVSLRLAGETRREKKV